MVLIMNKSGIFIFFLSVGMMSVALATIDFNAIVAAYVVGYLAAFTLIAHGAIGILSGNVGNPAED